MFFQGTGSFGGGEDVEDGGVVNNEDGSGQNGQDGIASIITLNYLLKQQQHPDARMANDVAAVR